MAEKRYCSNCGKPVTCREERRMIAGTYQRYATTLYCPRCRRRLGAVYGHSP